MYSFFSKRFPKPEVILWKTTFVNGFRKTYLAVLTSTLNFKMTASSELRPLTDILQQNNNFLAEEVEEAKFLPPPQHHKETEEKFSLPAQHHMASQDKFLLPPQHHTPDSVLQLLSSVLPLLSVYNI